MLNIKGENNMTKNAQKQANLRSDLWSLVYEVSQLDEELAKKLDIVMSDLQAVQFRIGMDKGVEIGLETNVEGRRLLDHMKSKENEQAYKLAHAFDDIKKEFPNMFGGKK